MILDQGIGAHHAQTEYLGMGWMATWVSGQAAADAIRGQWSEVIHAHAGGWLRTDSGGWLKTEANSRVEAHG